MALTLTYCSEFLPITHVKCTRKAKNFFSALLNAPKGLSVENPDFYEGQLSVKWRSDCFEDELALTTAWACTNEDPEYQSGCFHHAESLGWPHVNPSLILF